MLQSDKKSVILRQGVYVQVPGPQYETPQEIRLLRLLGGDAVGMSTVCEAIAGSHMGMKLCAISSIDNMGAGICGEKLTHSPKEEVSEEFQRLMTVSVKHIFEYVSEQEPSAEVNSEFSRFKQAWEGNKCTHITTKGSNIMWNFPKET